MNSSEIKKIILIVNLIILCVLGLVAFFVYKQLTKPMPKINPFVYVEPPPTEKIAAMSGLVTKSEVESVFNWKPPAPPTPPKPKVQDDTKPIAKEEPKSNISNLFTLETVMGRLAFITIKKERIIKSVIKGDEILDGNGAVIGVLQEVGEDYVLILINGKIEKLQMEGLDGVESDNPSTQTNVLSTTNKEGSTRIQGNDNKRIKNGKKSQEQAEQQPAEKSTVEATIEIRKKPEENIENSQARPDDNAQPNTNNQEPTEPKVVAEHKGNFNGIDFVFSDTVDTDGVLNRRIPEEMADKIQSKESIRILTSAKSYDLVFQANGVLIKNIIDPEARKFFTAFGISENDVILSVNGQSLGNKTEDDLIQLYQQIVDSAKYATIEILKNGQRQTFRVSTDRIKKTP